VDVIKMPPPGASAPRSSGATASESGSQPQANDVIAAVADRADIRPLDISSALQILLAEVRAAFALTASTMSSDFSIPSENPSQAARSVLQLFLQVIPQEEPVIPQDEPNSPAWTSNVAQAVEAAKEAQALISSALRDDPLNPAWLRPEWAGLAPHLERFRRRRRLAHRKLIDPDYPEGNADDGDKNRS
jgi:hypothetical protein